MEAAPPSRRSFLVTLGGVAGLVGIAAQTGIAVRSCVPNVSYDPPTSVKVGLPESFADGLTFLPQPRLFIVRRSKVFRALSAVCTHLGCTVHAEVQQEPDADDPDGRRQRQVQQFTCPCHGSRYAADGSRISGPAPAPLAVYRLSIALDDGQLVVETGAEAERDFALTVP